MRVTPAVTSLPKSRRTSSPLVDNMYGQFVHDVAVGRHTSDEKIRPLATGQVWTGQQSIPLGLIDQIGASASRSSIPPVASASPASPPSPGLPASDVASWDC